MRGKLNVRFLLLVLVGTAVFAVVWFVVYHFQTNRRLSDYLAQAIRAEEAEKFERAARLLRSYVLASPRDIDARIRYGELLEKMARTPRGKRDALSVYEQIVVDAPDRQDIRRRAAEIAVAIGTWDAAQNQLEKLPKDGRTLFLLGRCSEAQKRFESEKGQQGADREGAEEYYKQSYEAEPKPETFVRRAAVLRHLKRNEDADKVIGTLHEKLPGMYETHLACALYLHQYPEIEDDRRQQLHLLTQREHLAAARNLAPDRSDVLIASARLPLEEADKVRRRPGGEDPKGLAGYFDEARGYLQHGLSKSPKDVDLYLTLASVESVANQRDKAIECLTKARSQVSANRIGPVLLTLGELYADKLGEKDANATEVLAQIADVLAALKKAGEEAAKVDFVRGLALVRQGAWYEGSGVLERIRPILAAQPAMALRIDLLLAFCYGRMGDIDRQLLTARRAVLADPLDDRPRHVLADCLAALGRSDEAVDEYRHITQMERSSPRAWLALARLMVYQNLSRSEKDRRWEEVAKLLKAVKAATKDEAGVPLLEAEMLYSQGDRKGAKKLLEENLAARPKEAEFWCSLASLAYHEGDSKTAHDILDRATRDVGDNVEFRIARLRITSLASAKEMMGILQKAGEGQERFPEEERVRLLRALASAYWQLGQGGDAAAPSPEEAAAIREAGRLWGQVAQLRPTELQVRLLLFDMALTLNDEPGMRQALAEINRIEGGGAYGKYGEASRLIWRAVHQGDPSGLGEARNLLAVAAARRANWSRIPLSLARIDELQQNPDEELKHLKEAVDLGDRQIAVVKRLVRYLNERERRQEAYEIVNRLYTQAPLSNDLQRLAAEVTILQGQRYVDQAVRLAQTAVDANTKDYKERVWLAEMLSVGGRVAEADKHYEAAIRLAGDNNSDPLPWTSMILHTLRQREAASTESVRKEVNAKLESALSMAETKLGDKAPLALASCYELAGRGEKKDEEKYLKQAEEKYLAAIKADPRDIRALRATATFYQRRGEPEKAEPALRQMVAAETKAPAADVAWARRNLAFSLGMRKEKPDYDAALKLLDANAAAKGSVGEMVDDLRIRAMVTATLPGRRQEVISYLEQAEKLKPSQPEQEFLLARLYEAEGNWRKARDRMIRLISLRKDDVRYIASFADSLIRRGDYAEAEVWVSRLSELGSNQAQTLILQVEVMCRLGRARESMPLIRKYAEAKDGTPVEPAARALVVADLYDRAFAAGGGQECAVAAERTYSRQKDLSKEPDAALPMAAYYSRNNSPGKALALCEEALGKNCPLDRVLLAAIASLSGEAADRAHFAKVEEWLNQALAKEPDSDNLRFLFAILREFQGRSADAEAEYRKILARSPRNVLAANNLAFMLARTGKAKQEAVALIADTTIFGNLRETRAVVASIASGDLATARKDLEAAVADSGTASAYFHLAEVLAKLKDKPRAKEALRHAQLAGLRVGQLHPLERPIYSQLVADLKP